MRDCDDKTVFKSHDLFFDFFCRFFVQIGGKLIQQQYPALPKQRSGETEALLFAA